MKHSEATGNVILPEKEKLWGEVIFGIYENLRYQTKFSITW